MYKVLAIEFLYEDIWVRLNLITKWVGYVFTWDKRVPKAHEEIKLWIQPKLELLFCFSTYSQNKYGPEFEGTMKEYLEFSLGYALGLLGVLAYVLVKNGQTVGYG